MADKEDVYITLVMTDAYLPGAAVLAHSLRDAGSNKKLACLIVQDSLLESTITELRTLYNYVIPVQRIGNPNPANLYLMNRPDLLYTFTKIHLWAQTQFRKLVYIDADVVALRAPEELFDIGEPFAAAPDVGWPDAFNTGVMVISPHMGDYHALRGLANAGDSFDGADQGLLNQYYENRAWKRISFTYNTTPSANYQYEPAYRYFKRDISLVHFIGGEKPWQRDRSAHGTPNAFQEMLSRWWAVYDRHFHISTTDYIHGGRNLVTHYVQDQMRPPQVQGKESYSAAGYPVQTTGPAPPPHELSQSQHQYVPPPHGRHAEGTATPLMTEPGEPAENIVHGHVEPTPTVEQRRFSAPHMEWDATRGAPPMDSRPEAANFPTQTYEFNTDPQPFRPPPAYPEPPKDLWYSIPEKRQPEEKPRAIFPWEEREAAKPTRRFIEDEPPPLPSPPLQTEKEPFADELEVSSEDRFEPPAPTSRIGDDPWAAFTTSRNAWDDVAGIENYVRSLTSFQRNRGKVQVLQQLETSVPRTSQAAEAQQHILSPSNEPDPLELIEKVKDRRESLILTDFPTAVERPSLPVTPAPRRRPSFWGEERDDEGELPGADGVPDQVDWDPSAQLEQLRRNSLIGPGDLKLPEKTISRRKMPTTAVSIPEEDPAQSESTVLNRDIISDEATTLTAVSYATSREKNNLHDLERRTGETKFSESGPTSAIDPSTTTGAVSYASSSGSGNLRTLEGSTRGAHFGEISNTAASDSGAFGSQNTVETTSESSSSASGETMQNMTREYFAGSGRRNVSNSQAETISSFTSDWSNQTGTSSREQQSSFSIDNGTESRAYTTSSSSERSKETAINTAINSAASGVTSADKPFLSDFGFDRPSAGTVSATVGIDEVDMREAKPVTEEEEKWFDSSRTESDVGDGSVDRFQTALDRDF